MNPESWDVEPCAVPTALGVRSGALTNYVLRLKKESDTLLATITLGPTAFKSASAGEPICFTCMLVLYLFLLENLLHMRNVLVIFKIGL